MWHRSSQKVAARCSQMNPKNHARLIRLPRLVSVACLLLFSLAGGRGLASPYSGSFATSNLEISLYPDNSLQPDAIWKIDRILTDHKRMGFFHVQLMPILVVQGIQLEFTRTNPPANWLEGFQCKWVPAENRSTIEWRDFTVTFPHENVPRLHAARAHPVANAGPLVCRLEDVTLQAGSGPVHLPRAEVRTEGQAGTIVWQDSGATIQWDLFSGQFTTNTLTSNKGLKMKNYKLLALAVCFFAANLIAQTADQDVAQGRTDLVAHDLAGAYASFNAAATLSPTNAEANALLAVTRLLVLPQQAAGSNFLTTLGFSKTGRDIYNWQSTLPVDSNGNTKVPSVNTSVGIALYKSTVIPALGASLTNLSRITDPGFTLSLTADETDSPGRDDRLRRHFADAGGTLCGGIFRLHCQRA